MSEVVATVIPGLTHSRIVRIRDSRRQFSSIHAQEVIHSLGEHDTTTIRYGATTRGGHERQSSEDDQAGRGLCRPDLPSYYRVTRKAKVVTAYASDGQYFADVQPLGTTSSRTRMSRSSRTWKFRHSGGGPNRGVVCPPQAARCAIFPTMTATRTIRASTTSAGKGNGAPSCGLTELIVQQEPGTSIHIDKSHNVITLSPANWEYG